MNVFAKENCTSGSEFEPPLCSLKLLPITKITILQNAVKSPAESDPNINCKKFVINEKQVRRYFREAKTTTERNAHFTLDWSPCYATGNIEFKDGSKGNWSVDRILCW